jgi:hypothetical protein
MPPWIAVMAATCNPKPAVVSTVKVTIVEAPLSAEPLETEADSRLVS